MKSHFKLSDSEIPLHFLSEHFEPENLENISIQRSTEFYPDIFFLCSSETINVYMI